MSLFEKLHIREPLLKGKAQYSWPPCTNSFRSAAFDIGNKTSYLNEEVNGTELVSLRPVTIGWRRENEKIEENHIFELK